MCVCRWGGPLARQNANLVVRKHAVRWYRVLFIGNEHCHSGLISINSASGAEYDVGIWSTLPLAPDDIPTAQMAS